MIDVEEFDKETSERFSVVSYNTLAQNACKEVPYCRPQHLTPVGRRKLFHREIADLDADILGLQDVDNYDLWWREMLSSLGYDSVFQRRSQARGSWEEGLVLAWRRTRFQLVASHAFDFNDVPAEGTVQGYLVQDNVAQMVALQPFERSRAPTGLCVANAQLCRLPGREDVRLAQAQALVRTIEAFNSDFHFPVILTASLYSNPAGQTYGMLATGKLPLDPKAPSRAGKPEVEVDSPSSIRLRWAPSEIDYFALSPYLEGYRIQWRPGGNRFVGFAGEKFVEDEDSKVYLTRGGHFLEEPFRTTLVTGLASGIPYEFRVCGVNAVGDGPWSPLSSPVRTTPLEFGALPRGVLKDVPTLQLDQHQAAAAREGLRFDRAGHVRIEGFADRLQADRHTWVSLSGLTPRYASGQPNRLAGPVRSPPKDQAPPGFQPVEVLKVDPAEVESDSDDEGRRGSRPTDLEGRTDTGLGQRDPLQEHCLNLRSAYASYGPLGEPALTAATHRGCGALDYVFYSWEGLRPVQLLSIPEFEEFNGVDPRALMMEVDGTYETLPSWCDDTNSITSMRTIHTADDSNVQVSTTNLDAHNYMGEWVPFIRENPLKAQHLIPNSIFPSDHISIKAVLEYIHPQLATTTNSMGRRVTNQQDRQSMKSEDEIEQAEAFLHHKLSKMGV